MEEIQERINAEREKIKKQKNLKEAERDKLSALLEKREKKVKKAFDEQRALQEKLDQLEKKIIVGGENLLEKAEKQAKLLEESEKRLQNTKQKEADLKKRLNEKEAEKIDLEEKYSSMADEIKSKTAKLKKLRTMILEAKAELQFINDEHQRTKDSLLDDIRETAKDVKLQLYIINSYIPQEFQSLIEENIVWNENLGEWQLKYIAYTGNHMRKQKN